MLSDSLIALLIHGKDSSSGTWKEFLQYFEEHNVGIEFLTFDVLGHGAKSERFDENCSPDMYREAVLQDIKSFVDLNRKNRKLGIHFAFVVSSKAEIVSYCWAFNGW